MNKGKLTENIKKIQNQPLNEVIDEITKRNSFLNKINIVIDDDDDKNDLYQRVRCYVDIKKDIEYEEISFLVEMIGDVITKNGFLLQQKEFDFKGIM